MRYIALGRFGAAAALAACLAAPALAQHQAAGAPGPNAAAGVTLQQQQLNNSQQIYNQGQQAIQGGAQAHFQSQQMLSTMSQRNQAQLDAQTPKPLTSPTTTGTLH